MSSQILPKKRVVKNNGSRAPSGRISSIPEHRVMSNNRAISMRLASNNRIISNHRIISGSRRASRSLNKESDLNDSFGDENAIHFDENKHTILSNFEEWIKLSTDNKITSKNSWQFALIDYFHDLNVIKDGENINFQRASATLDGCVKIYSSRVESVATETGKLLSGLSKNNTNAEAEDNENEANGANESDSLDEVESEGKKKRKINRVVESTLVPFDAIQIKKFEQELAIDPLFKKALAEFDEGGAKSLLLNTLNIDSSGRVVFDATTNPIKDNDEQKENSPLSDSSIDISQIEGFIFKDNNSLDDLTICPTIQQIKYVLQDVSKAKTVLRDVNNQFLSNEQFNDIAKADGYEEGLEFANYDYDDFDGDDFDNDINDITNENNNLNNNINQSIVQQLLKEPEPYTKASSSTQILDRDLMAYFDDKMKANWRGPEHWRVSAIKKSKNLGQPINNTDRADLDATKPTQARKKKEQTIINFFEDDDDDNCEDNLFESPKSILSITKPYPEDDISSKKLPEDIQYNSSKLTNLFTKPQLPILCFSNRRISKATESETLTDENFFAKHYQTKEEEQDRLAASFHQAEYEDFNNDFGGDDDFGGIDFNDAFEGTVSNNNDSDKDTATTESAHLLAGRKSRPDYVNFSRIAKKVDVKLLKDNLWKTIKKEKPKKELEEKEGNKDEDIASNSITKPSDNAKTFAEVVTSIGIKYGTEQRKDLSTSFCFICLLHLANEHGLTISTNEAHDDLLITGF